MLDPPVSPELPEPPLLGGLDITDPNPLWKLGREWSGYPELEWTPAIYSDRVLAFSGVPGVLFYEQLSEFAVTRFLVRVGSLLHAKKEASYPSVNLGFRYFESTYHVADGRLITPEAGEPFRGRHYVAAFDHRSPDEIAFANSWGGRWGNHGYGAITREYFDAHVDFVGVRWSAVGGPSPRMIDCLNGLRVRRLPRAERIPDCWTTPNEFADDELLFRGMPHRLVTWTVMSHHTNRVVEVFEIRHPVRIAARAHLFFDPQ